MMHRMHAENPVYDALVEVIAEELYTRVVMGPRERGDQIETQDDARHFAETVAAALLSRFSITDRR